MNLSIFSVHDSKAEAFICPFFAQNTAVGLRMFTQACNDISTEFYRNAGDFTLFEMGIFDQDTGKFELFDVAKNHGLAVIFRTEGKLAHIPNVPAAKYQQAKPESLKNLKVGVQS